MEIKQGGLNSEHSLPVDSLSNHFYQYFKLVIANTPELREEVYKIRYKVYSQELNYEREENCWKGMEQDIYDPRSIHCLLMHRSSGLYAGCVRLILADPRNPEATFPFEKICHYSLAANSTNLNNLPRSSFCEVSRLAVTAEFRKRKGEAQTPHGVSYEESESVENERRHFPLIALGLYLAATSVFLDVGLDSIFTLMEPRLARHLRRFGFHFHQIGDLVEHRGKRGGFQITREAILNNLNPDVLELLQVIHSDLKMSIINSVPSLLDCRAA